MSEGSVPLDEHLPVEAPYLQGLNPEQRAAVLAEDGPLLILAGAGTGKTRVLTTRLAHMLMTRGIYPSQLLAVTFTNKAAREMVARVEQIMQRNAQGLWLGTFHSIGARILRRHAELVGLQSSFTIIDTDDQIRLLKQVLRAADIDEKRWPARQLLGIIQRWKDRGYTPGKVPASEIGDFAIGRSCELYGRYQERLLSLNACDFGDLLLHNLSLFAAHADILRDYQQRFRAVLVDEYQDTNVAQYLWLRLLAQSYKNITCVGDDDQSIYSWRGAEVGNILRFERDFPGAQVIRLERNYRSSGHILGAAGGLIANNAARMGKTLWTEGAQGERVAIAGLWDDQEEARFVSERIAAHRDAGGALSDTAVLVRAGHQTRAFEERFIQIGMPYRVVGGLRFYERAEIRDAIAYLRLINSFDDDLAFERIVNTPKRGLGEASTQTIARHARAQELSQFMAARALCATDELSGRARNALRLFTENIERWRHEAPELTPRALCERVLEESGYTDMWRNDKSPDAPTRLDNLKELALALDEFETLGGFLEHVSLVMDNASDPEADMVVVMTLHAAKGLEFDGVFLAGWEEGLFPNQRALDEGGNAALEEERRLAYVGITRARRRCTISFASNRRFYGQWSSSIPSRFIEELPAEHIDVLHRSPRSESEPSGWFDSVQPSAKVAAFSARRSQRDGLLIEGRAQRLDSAAPASGFALGQRIFHQKFGYGRIEGITGDKIDIAFEKSGRKRVLASFIEAA
ncbi:MAG: ATP-dependent helicase [Geminicoccaceae bacterium]